MQLGTSNNPSAAKLHAADATASSRSPRICALITCFNRREKTIACLDALAASAGFNAGQLHAVLVDDGSTDGTAQAVRERFPWVQVLQADGALFWCRGMHLAFETAMRAEFDAYLWLNDDTMLQPDALSRLRDASLALERISGAPVIVVGSTVDAMTGALTYGGERRPSRLAPLRIERVQPATSPQRCDSMTGNIVLISAEAARRVGNIDPVFEHSMGDTDYALRANKLGVQVWVDAGVHGTCSYNSAQGTWCDASQPLRRRWKDMMSRKGLPWRSWLAMTRRHAGPLWPLYFALPYVKVVLQGVVGPVDRQK
jgi:GT2 family glycosyltransferase